MNQEDGLMLGLMIAAPAVIGLSSLILAILLFGTAGKQDAYRMVKLVLGVVLMTVALGIGACYGIAFFGGSRIAG